MESSSIEDDFVVLSLLKKKRKKKERKYWVHPILKYREDGEFPLLIKEQRDYHGRFKVYFRMSASLVRWLWTVKNLSKCFAKKIFFNVRKFQTQCAMTLSLNSKYWQPCDRCKCHYNSFLCTDVLFILCLLLYLLYKCVYLFSVVLGSGEWQQDVTFCNHWTFMP